MKKKVGLVFDIVIIILAGCLVHSVFNLGFEIHDMLTDYGYEEHSFIYRMEDEEYGYMLTMYYDNCGSDGKGKKEMQEYYSVARYYEAAFHHHMYAEAGDTVRADKYKKLMDAEKEQLKDLAFVADKIDKRLGK